ncbi:hypothetical protein VTK56DRAFT_4589 [Thermocarpiscus australiensis]
MKAQILGLACIIAGALAAPMRDGKQAGQTQQARQVQHRQDDWEDPKPFPFPEPEYPFPEDPDFGTLILSPSKPGRLSRFGKPINVARRTSQRTLSRSILFPRSPICPRFLRTPRTLNFRVTLQLRQTALSRWARRRGAATSTWPLPLRSSFSHWFSRSVKHSRLVPWG